MTRDILMHATIRASGVIRRARSMRSFCLARSMADFLLTCLLYLDDFVLGCLPHDRPAKAFAGSQTGLPTSKRFCWFARSFAGQQVRHADSENRFPIYKCGCRFRKRFASRQSRLLTGKQVSSLGKSIADPQQGLLVRKVVL